MKPFLLCILSSLLLMESIHAQAIPANIAAMGSCESGAIDASSVYTNPAGLPYSAGTQTLFTHNANFFLHALDIISVGAAHAGKSYGLGLLFQQQGDHRLTDQKLDISYGRSFGPNWSMGVKFSAGQWKFSDNYGRKLLFSMSAGFIARMSEKSRLTFFIQNLNRQVVLDAYNERLPAIMQLGFNHKFSPLFHAVVEFESASGRPFNLKLGARYMPVKNVDVSLGFQSLYRRFSFGFGYVKGRFKSNMAFTWSSNPGMTTSATLVFILKSGDEGN